MLKAQTTIRRLLPLAAIAVVVFLLAARATKTAGPVEAAASTIFIPTGAQQNYTVPAGVTIVLVQADGAGGGTSTCGALGGFGQSIKALVTVTPGQTLFVEVGGQGLASTAGGFNGGGAGGASLTAAQAGAGGGGAADVRTISNLSAGTLGSRLVTSGGGGGGGGCGNGVSTQTGGGAGGSTPSGAGATGAGTPGGGGGAGSAGGAAGAGTPNGTAGTTGVGGDGGLSTAQTFRSGAGGGGGGGLAGGGGGGAGNFTNFGSGGGGGGSGSSGVAAGVTQLSTGANPVLPAQVIITPIDAVTITKAFNPTSVQLNGNSTMTITISNSNAIVGLTGVAMSDSLPAGVRVAAVPAVSNTCGGTITAAAGSGTVSLANGAIAAGGSCNFTVAVQGITVGVWVNTTSTVTSNEAPPSNVAVATLTVTTVPVVSTPIPSPIPTVAPTVAIIVPVPVFQNPAAGGLFNPIAKTPTPRAVVAPVIVDPAVLALPTLRPPNTGDAGLRAELTASTVE